MNSGNSAWPQLAQLVARHGQALTLTLRGHDQPLPRRFAAALVALHMLGVLAVVRLTHQPLWLGLVLVLAVQPLLASWRLKRWQLRPECLAPLGLAYAVLILRIVAAGVARAQGATSGALSVPEPWASWLDLNIATGVAGIWVLQAQASLTAEALGSRVWGYTLACVLALPTVAWSAATYPGLATHGVTGSDPYAYAQMALDLAHRGLPVHTFRLVPRLFEWGLPVWPAVPVGYGVPSLGTGEAATVWPPGYSVWLAAAWLLAGEAGLYWLTPLLGLVALAATGLLCWEILRPWQNGWRWLAAGLAVFVLATSRQQIERLAVPMADIPAQLFSLLTIYFALRAIRQPARRYAFVAGLCLGMAFAVRYTQVLLAVSLLAGGLFAAWRQSHPGRTLLQTGAWCAAGTGLMAIPVLAYHTLVFGGPFSVGSAELSLFGWEYLPQTAVSVAGDLLRANEFLFLLPLLIWGAIRLWQTCRLPAVMLLAWLLAIVLFHLPYAALRTRDVLSVFPVLAVWVGVGAADLLARILFLPRSTRRGLWWVLACTLLLGLLWVRTRFTFQVNAGNFVTFGHLRADQRAAFDSLAAQTSSQAVVAASLNSGAVELYTGRDTVRPAYWSTDEWLSFVAHATKDGRPVLILVDGAEMQEPLAAIRARYPLALVSWLSLPYFERDGTSQNIQVPLYRVSSP
jgi:hypothetical protein